MSDEKRFPDDYHELNPWVAYWRHLTSTVPEEVVEAEFSRDSFKEAADAVEREIDPQDA